MQISPLHFVKVILTAVLRVDFRGINSILRPIKKLLQYLSQVLVIVWARAAKAEVEKNGKI